MWYILWQRVCSHWQEKAQRYIFDILISDSITSCSLQWERKCCGDSGAEWSQHQRNWCKWYLIWRDKWSKLREREKEESKEREDEPDKGCNYIENFIHSALCDFDSKIVHFPFSPFLSSSLHFVFSPFSFLLDLSLLWFPSPFSFLNSLLKYSFFRIEFSSIFLGSTYCVDFPDGDGRFEGVVVTKSRNDGVLGERCGEREEIMRKFVNYSPKWIWHLSHFTGGTKWIICWENICFSEIFLTDSFTLCCSLWSQRMCWKASATWSE